MNIDQPARSQYPELKSLWQQAFGDTPGFIEGFFQTGFSPERCRCITLNHQVASALYWFDCSLNGEKWAYIYAVATDTAHRGKGLCAALMEDTHRHLREVGYYGAVLVPAEDHLWRYYGKFGYLPFGSIASTTIAAGEPVRVEEISPDVYCELRQQYLPENPLDQRSAYPFYSTWGKFYRSQNCCFAGAKDEDTLYIQEFLGDPSPLPGIVDALNCKTGNVRLSGGDAPCGMYLSFCAAVPGYLGFALD